MNSKSEKPPQSWEPISQWASRLTDPVTAQAIAPLISARIAELPDFQYVQLDHYVRKNSYWWRCKPSDVNRISALTNSAAAAGILSMHSSGYIRQAAVQALSKFKDGSEIPFLLLRLSDWVPQVSAVAARAIDQRISLLAQIVTHNMLLQHIKQRHRLTSQSDVARTIARLDSALQAPGAFPTILSEFKKMTNPKARRACFQLLLESQCQNKAEAIEMALNDNDQFIRIRALRSASNQLSPNSVAYLMGSCLHDPTPAVRVEALRLLSASPDSARGSLETALIDRSASVRNIARFQLRKLGMMTNFAEFYKQRIEISDKASSLAAAIAGLGETGSREDVGQLEGYLANQQAAVVKSVISALSSLDGKCYVLVFLEKLSNEHPCISNAASKALQAQGVSIIGEPLFSVFQQNQQYSVRRNVLHLMNKLEKWERISYLMQCRANTDDGVLVEIIGQFIDSWLFCYRATWQFTRPTQEQTQKIKMAYSSICSLLTESQAEFFEICIRGI